jgi:signal peptidase I
MRAARNTSIDIGMDGGPDLASRVTRLMVAGAMVAGIAGVSPFRLGIVDGRSMAPILQPGQPFIYSKETPGCRKLRRGDLVLVQMGGDVCVKRIFALPGAQFWSVDRPRDDAAPITPLAFYPPIREWRERYPLFRYRRVDVPKDSVFLLGEGPRSLDSRQLGAVPLGCVLGRVVLPQAPAARAFSGAMAWVDHPRAAVYPPHAWRM